MKVKWQDMAKNMATSISQLIRTAVQAYGRDVEQDLKRASEEIERAGQEMEKAGQEMERMFHGKGRPGGDDPSLERRPSGAGASRADAVGSGYPVDPLDQLRKLKELLDMGAITDEEYKEKKTKLLDMV
ncbi:MAG: SHOCT domain-containing protein [Candidatus Lokiarchaeota archaeon]|nr:SHOCT domain-containing protein [Candidatus Lokiarchaeota archaeon]